MRSAMDVGGGNLGAAHGNYRQEINSIKDGARQSKGFSDGRG